MTHKVTSLQWASFSDSLFETSLLEITTSTLASLHNIKDGVIKTSDTYMFWNSSPDICVSEVRVHKLSEVLHSAL